MGSKKAAPTSQSKAQVSAVAAEPCDGAWTIKRLSADERATLHAACQGKSVPPAALHQTLRRLLGTDGWNAGALAWLVGPARRRRWTWAANTPGSLRASPPEIDGLQRAIDRSIEGFASGQVCPKLRHSSLITDLIAAASNDTEVDELPFDSDFLRCLGIDERQSEGTRLLTIRTDGLESLVLSFGDTRSTMTRYFGRDDMLVLGKHRFVIAAVPQGTPVALLGEHRGQEIPLHWHSVVGRNQAIWMTPVRQACINLNVRLAENDRLFIDGHEVLGLANSSGGLMIDQPMILSRDLPQAAVPDHEISVLTCDAERACDIRYLSTIPGTTDRPQPRLICEPFRLDLRPRKRQQVAIIRTNRETCKNSPLWADDLRDRVRYFLTTDERHRSQRELADVHAYAEISSALASLEGEIQDSAGKANGPDRGTDTSEALGTVAKEAWRQGLDTLMTFSVLCQPKPDAPDEYTYSLQGMVIGVDEIFGRGFYGDAGLDLDRFIQVETVAFETPALQDAAIATLLDRLFNVPSSRFLHNHSSTYYRERVQLRVGTVFPENEQKSPSLRVIVKRLPRRGSIMPSPLAERGQWRPRICDRLTRMSRAEQQTMEDVAEILDSAPGKSTEVNLLLSREGVDDTVSPRSAVHARDLRLPLPGWYLVARQDKDGDISDAICIDSHHNPREIWGQVTQAGGPTIRTSTNVEALLTRVHVGYARYILPGLGIGLRGGYQFVYYNLKQGVATWQDLEVNSSAIKWQRHSLVLGPLLEGRTRFTRIPVEFRARISPFLDVGLVWTPAKDIPITLTEFRQGKIIDTFVDFDTGIDFDFIIGHEVGKVQMQYGLAISLMAIDDSAQATAGTAADNFAGVFGITLGVGRGDHRRGQR
ncbi:MAG TPA: hypothetical protein ENJ18_08340 [Nannocystis exedens]|nr:hypothetical protein [Nannocystis exedens]